MGGPLKDDLVPAMFSRAKRLSSYILLQQQYTVVKHAIKIYFDIL
jgi:hypothetical protein